MRLPTTKQIKNVTIDGNSDRAKITYLGPTFDPIHYPAKSYSFERRLLDRFDIQKNYTMQEFEKQIAPDKIAIYRNSTVLPPGNYTIVAFTLSGKITKPIIIEIKNASSSSTDYISPSSSSSLNNNTNSKAVTVVIPLNSNLQETHKNFEPSLIKVIIGVNNTVNWINKDDVPASVVAETKDDLLFWNETNNAYGIIDKIHLLLPNQTFSFTFTKPGVFGYHSVPGPYRHGYVIVSYPKDWQACEPTSTSRLC